MFKLTLAIAVLALAMLAPVAHATDPWPSDSQNAFNWRSTDTGAPFVGQTPQLRKLFEVQVPGAVEGTPIIADNNGVYFGTVAGTAYVVPQDRSAQGSGTPDGGIVTGAKGLIFWARYVGGPIRGSMLKVGDSVYAVANPYEGPRLVSMDPLTGNIKWSTQLDNQRGINSCSGPQYAAAAGLIIVGLTDCQAERGGTSSNLRGAVVAVNAVTGQVAWKTYTALPGQNGAGVHGTPVVWDNQSKVYVVTGHAYSGVAGPNTDSILQLDLATGSILKRYQSYSGDSSNNNSTIDPQHRVGFTSTPIAVGRTIPYIGVGGDDGKFYLVNMLTMQLVSATQIQLPGDHLGTVNASTWGINKGGQNGTIFSVTSTPSYFFGINPDTGALGPVFPAANGVLTGPPTLSRDYVWEANVSGFLDMYSADDGHLAWRIPIGTPTTGGVSFYNERAFVAVGIPGGTNGGLVAFEVPKQ